MQLRSFSKASEFRDQAFPFLLGNEAQNCLGLGIVDTLISRPEIYPKAYLWSFVDAGRTVGVAWMTPPYPIGLSEMPEQALHLLLEEASGLTDRPKAVVGPKAQSDYFASKWKARHGLSASSTIEQGIYQLTDVIKPVPVPGEMRVVEQADQSLLEEWNFAFIRDCGLNDSIEAAKVNASQAIKTRSRYIWSVNGEPVSMAGASGSTPSGIRIGWVYTPNDLRGHGYASAIVAELSQKMLTEGRKFCFLYTDLANPTSNSIYRKIGYRHVCDSTHHIFEA